MQTTATEQTAVGAPGPAASGVAFEQVYDQHVDFVWRTLARVGVRSSQVEDAVQDVFIVVHRRLPDFRGPGSVRAWLASIALKVAHDHRRVVHRKSPAGPLDEAAEVADPGRGPAELASANQARELMQQLLAALDVDQREVFVLAELEELTAPEIVAATGVTLNTVYSRLRLARARFNELVTELKAKRGGL